MDWNERPLFKPQTQVAEARVQNGAARSVQLVSQAPIYTVTRFGCGERISLRVVYDGPLVAPISKGSQVAQLEVRVGNREPGRVPLFAGRAVAVAGPLDRIVNGLVGLFS